jgi:hypothetical protein
VLNVILGQHSKPKGCSAFGRNDRPIEEEEEEEEALLLTFHLEMTYP